MIVRLRAAAAADLLEIYRYLAERSPGGADNVLRAIQSSINSIADQPFASQTTEEPLVRMKVVQRYRYDILRDHGKGRGGNIAHSSHIAAAMDCHEIINAPSTAA
jgi:plasmid stabilization system protein ParE